MKSRALKLFRASGVQLATVPDHHRSHNGGKQVDVLIRCATKRRFAELVASIFSPADKGRIESSYRYLSTYCCWSEVEPGLTRYEWYDNIAVKPDTIYYNPNGHTVSGYFNEWFELPPYSR